MDKKELEICEMEKVIRRSERESVTKDILHYLQDQINPKDTYPHNHVAFDSLKAVIERVKLDHNNLEESNDWLGIWTKPPPKALALVWDYVMVLIEEILQRDSKLVYSDYHGETTQSVYKLANGLEYTPDKKKARESWLEELKSKKQDGTN